MESRLSEFDRPYLVSWAFTEFSHAVLKVITKKIWNYFGFECVAYTTRLEFQERNSLHYHVLMWLYCKIVKDPYEVDHTISAEFPIAKENDELFKLIKWFIIHR